MSYAFDTNIFQIWRNINDPAIQKISAHPTVQTVKGCFLEVEAGAQLTIPRIILTEHLVWIAKNEGVDVAFKVLESFLESTWQITYEDEEIHREAIEIGSRYGGLGAADLLLAAIAKREKATIVTIDSAFERLRNEIDVIVLESIADLI
ncbi:MAG: PIN domain-containing protein [Candidatus Methanoperedens sp.]|nr:PIN domain-containing protein [Candidatus Methanoperedens sp.]